MSSRLRYLRMRRMPVYAAQPTPRNRDAFNVDLYELDLRTGTEKTLVAQPGRDADPSYSPDGRWIASIRKQDLRTTSKLAMSRLCLPAEEPYAIITAQARFRCISKRKRFTWSPDSRTLIYTAGKGVQDILVSQDLQFGRSEGTLGRRSPAAASFTSDGSQAVLLKTSPDEAAGSISCVSGILNGN